MPSFRLRAWAEQTLYDCDDYLVEADTIEAAAERLYAVVEDADWGGKYPDGVRRIVYTRDDGEDVLTDETTLLDPHEVIDGEDGIAEIGADGSKLRNILPVPTERGTPEP